MAKMKKEALTQKVNQNDTNSPSAKSHLDRNTFMASVGLPLKKVYLSHDSLKKLAKISESRFGKDFDEEELVTEYLSELIDFCINKCYRTEENIPKKEHSLPSLTVPKTIEGLTLSKYHQMATYFKNNPPIGSDGDHECIAKVFNNAKRRVPYTESIADYVSDYYKNKTSLQAGKDWEPKDIQAILNKKRINKYINSLNEDSEWEKEWE